MKKLFVVGAVIVLATALMLALGTNFSQAAEKMMTPEDAANSCRQAGQVMMDKGKMLKEGTMDKATMQKECDSWISEGEKIVKEGEAMKAEGNKMMKGADPVMKEKGKKMAKEGDMMIAGGKKMVKDGKMMKEGKMDAETMKKEGADLWNMGEKLLTE